METKDFSINDIIEAVFQRKLQRKIIKRDGSEAQFTPDKIRKAVTAANNDVPPYQQMTDMEIAVIVDNVTKQVMDSPSTVTVENIQDMVEIQIMRFAPVIAQKYIRYRFRQELKRKANTTDGEILSLLDCNNEEVKQENSNKNPTVASVQRDYMAGASSKDLSRRILLPKDVVEAHDAGIIHFHDMDYFSQHIFNCCLVNMEDMLQNGTVISGIQIDKPKGFQTACTVATQIISVVASNQYGGQSVSLAHLAPFVDISRKKWQQRVRETLEGVAPETMINELAEKLLVKECEAGMQTVQYQINTLMTTNGQSPFVTLGLYLGEVDDPQTKADLAMLIEITLKQRILGVKNEKGVYITPAFPKLVYVLEEDNITEGSKYWYLTELAAKCTAKRMVPDYVSEKIMKQYKVDENGEGHCYPPMGCRSFLTPYINKDGKPQYFGRFNQGVVTINLPDVALSSGGDMKLFWEIFEDRLELCHRALQERHNRLKGTLSDVSPIHWQHGAIARIEKGKPIDEFLYGGYSTISLGYAGLYECVKYMTGTSHTSETGKPFALEVMQKMNDKCNEWKTAENIAYSVYGTPLESTTYKFAKALQRRFGVIPGITDRGYISNSFHVHVAENITWSEKLKFEAEFQRLSPGGTISYVEVPNLQDNIPAVLSIIRFIYDNIMYAELNSKSDYCQCCGYDGEIKIEEEAGKLIWKCPNCGNTDQNKMNVARRTCGYIGTQFWNQGRTQEIRDRVLHVSSSVFPEKILPRKNIDFPEKIFE